MCIEVADAEDDSLIVSATSQKYFKRFIYLGLNTPQPTYKDASLQNGVAVQEYENFFVTMGKALKRNIQDGKDPDSNSWQ